MDLAGQLPKSVAGMLAWTNLARRPTRDAQGTRPNPIGMSPRQKGKTSESEMIVWTSASRSGRADVSIVAAMASAPKILCRASA
jgi:hypothetical protein